MKIEIISWEYLFGKGAKWNVLVDNVKYNFLVNHRFKYDDFFFDLVDGESLSVSNLENNVLLVGEYWPLGDLPEDSFSDPFIGRVEYIDKEFKNGLKISDLIYEIAGNIHDNFNDLDIFNINLMVQNMELIKEYNFELPQDYLDQKYLLGPGIF